MPSESRRIGLPPARASLPSSFRTVGKIDRHSVIFFFSNKTTKVPPSRPNLKPPPIDPLHWTKKKEPNFFVCLFGEIYLVESSGEENGSFFCAHLFFVLKRNGQF